MKKKLILSITTWIVVVTLVYVLLIPKTDLKTISYFSFCLGSTGTVLSLYNIIRRKKNQSNA